MNDENLIPHQFTSGKVARENGRKGGLKKAKNEKVRRTVRDALLLLRDCPLDNEKLRNRIKENTPITDEEITHAIGLAYMAVNYTYKGSAQWARLLFEMMGENDVQGVQKCQPNIEVVFSDKVEKDEGTVSDSV